MNVLPEKEKNSFCDNKDVNLYFKTIKKANRFFMKKVIFFSLIILVCTSCKKTIQDAVQTFQGFDATLSTVEFDLPAVPFAPPFEVALGQFPQHFDFDSLVKVNTAGTFSSADIVSVKLKSMSVKITNADATNNLGNFQSARFEFSSNANTTPVEVASVTFPDAVSDTISVSPSNTPELKGYLAGKELNYKVFGQLRRPTSKPLHLKINTIVTVR